MRGSSLLSVLLGVVLCCSAPQSPEVGNTTNPAIDFQPNIIWIVAEDMSPNIPAFGDSTIVTAHLDRLAAEGVCYDRFFTPHPVCAPARAAIITGMYANSIGASHMRTGPWFPGVTPEFIKSYGERALPPGFDPYEAIPPPEARMFSEYLRTAGYYCTNNSKEDYQFRKTMTAWDKSSNEAHWKDRVPGQPFFSVFNIGVTHESRIWAKAEDSLWVKGDLDVPVPPYLPDTEVGRTDIRRMYSNILEMDARVGELLSELEEANLMDSTIIFWYTDHGGPRPRQKRLLYESGIKVPMIIRFPGQADGGTRDARMTSFVDLAPTVMSLVGLEPPGHMHGSAFLGVHSRTEEPTYVHGAADRFDELMDRARSIRDDRYKLIKYYMPEKPMYLDVGYRRQMPTMQELLRLRDAGELTPDQALWFRETKPPHELFDTHADPHEINDLAEDPSMAEKIEVLSTALDQWIAEIDDTGMIPEEELMATLWPEGSQPVTADPILTILGTTVSISCETEGASIGYQILSSDDEVGDTWCIYAAPFQIEEGAQVVAVAHRLGYLRSGRVILSTLQ